MVGSLIVTVAERATELSPSVGRWGTSDGEAIRDGVHSSASRASEQNRTKDF